MAKRRGEFALIEELLAPLAAGHLGAFGLKDDAATLRVPDGQELVVTADMTVAGVHFAMVDAPADIASKTLRVNLSDLAAMGATPRGYLMTIARPSSCNDQWMAEFAVGLKSDQDAFGLSLIGGDTVATAGPLTLSVTALGTVAIGSALRRNGARPGDDLYVSGTIGDAALALAISEAVGQRLGTSKADFLRQRLVRPTPRISLGRGLVGVASSAIDISDGLVADLQHICDVSHVGADVRVDEIPLSEPTDEALLIEPDLIDHVLAGGDDYELLFTAAPSLSNRVTQAAHIAKVSLAKIGTITESTAIVLRRADGLVHRLGRTGYTHF